ncbi:MAG: hypothetical protein HC830_02740, partial [Bacteroidetes bacterium]|nr:hypothetical protein [Bacteroidota bacterium]
MELSEAANQNRILTQQIVLYSEATGQGRSGAPAKILKAVEAHDKLLQIIKNGGNTGIYDDSKDV